MSVLETSFNSHPHANNFLLAPKTLPRVLTERVPCISQRQFGSSLKQRVAGSKGRGRHPKLLAGSPLTWSFLSAPLAVPAVVQGLGWMLVGVALDFFSSRFHAFGAIKEICCEFRGGAGEAGGNFREEKGLQTKLKGF